MQSLMPCKQPEVYSSFNALDDLREFLDRSNDKIAYQLIMKDKDHISSLIRLTSGEVRLEHASQGFFDRIRRKFFKGNTL